MVATTTTTTTTDGRPAPGSWWKLTADQRGRVLAQLGTDEQRLAADAATLRAWVNMQPHLPFLPERELYALKAYLVNCKNSMEQAKKGLDTYFTARSAHFDFFGKFNVTEKEMLQYSRFMHTAVSEELTPELHRIVTVRTTAAEQTPEDFARMCRLNLIKADLAMRVDTALGYEIVLDMANFTPNHGRVLAMSLTTMKNYLTCTLGAIPARVKHVHIVNAPAVFTATFPLVQPLLKDKIRKRFLVHDSLKSLHSYVPAKYLSKDTGGDLPPIEEMDAQLADFMCSLSDFYAFQRTLRTDESKRPGGPSKMHNEAFGCEGSFRKLALD